MTPAQREQLNIFLFEQVMGRGWEALVPDYIEDWNSCQFLINKIERDGWVWCWDSYDNRYTFEIMRDCESGPNENSLVFHASGETRTEALCLAIAKAYGWKEER